MRALKRVLYLGAAVALGASALPAQASASSCSQPGYEAFKRFPAAVFVHQTRKSHGTDYEHVYVCAPTYGLRVRLGRFNYDPDFDYYGRLVARGRTAAWATAVGDESGKTYLDRIGRIDLATGRRSLRSAVWHDTYSGYDYTGVLRAAAVADSGSIAWMVDFKKHGEARREVHIWDSKGSRIVSRSLVTTPKYLVEVLGTKPSNVTFANTSRKDWPLDADDSAP